MWRQCGLSSGVLAGLLSAPRAANLTAQKGRVQAEQGNEWSEMIWLL